LTSFFHFIVHLFKFWFIEFSSRPYFKIIDNFVLLKKCSVCNINFYFFSNENFLFTLNYLAENFLEIKKITVRRLLYLKRNIIFNSLVFEIHRDRILKSDYASVWIIILNPNLILSILSIFLLILHIFTLICLVDLYFLYKYLYCYMARLMFQSSWSCYKLY